MNAGQCTGSQPINQVLLLPSYCVFLRWEIDRRCEDKFARIPLLIYFFLLFTFAKVIMLLFSLQSFVSDLNQHELAGRGFCSLKNIRACRCPGFPGETSHWGKAGPLGGFWLWK